MTLTEEQGPGDRFTEVTCKDYCVEHSSTMGAKPGKPGLK